MVDQLTTKPLVWGTTTKGKPQYDAGERPKNRLRVFENRVLRGIFGAKRDEVTGEWRKLHNGKLHDLYSSPNIVRVIKSGRMR
jgi:hypothetical protein